VDPVTGRVFVAHSDFGTVDVVDRDTLQVATAIEGCPDGSGVLCAGTQRLVFAAARAAGKVLLIDPDRLEIIREITVGPRPNGLAWDGGRGRLLVADVDPSDQAARLIDVSSSELITMTPLPGRPRLVRVRRSSGPLPHQYSGTGIADQPERIVWSHRRLLADLLGWAART